MWEMLNNHIKNDSRLLFIKTSIMKKKHFLLLVFSAFFAFNLIVANTSNVVENKDGFNLLQQVKACTATLECANGQTVSCDGTQSCHQGTDYVKCDGNYTWCGAS